MSEQKKYRLDLSEYSIPKPGSKLVDNKTVIYPLRENLADFLRTAGMFKTAVEVVDAVMLAREIAKCTAEFLILDEKEASVLKAVLDKLISLTADGRASVGGITHEEVICRVVNMEEITE